MFNYLQFSTSFTLVYPRPTKITLDLSGLSNGGFWSPRVRVSWPVGGFRKLVKQGFWDLRHIVVNMSY